MSVARILIVEDEKMIASIMSMMLSKEGYSSEAVSTGAEAVRCALMDPPDLILMDIKLMGDIDGITACKLINDELDVPVIFISAFADKRVIARAMQCNASVGYIIKPFKYNQLIDEIRSVLKDRQFPSENGVEHAVFNRFTEPVDV
jgi:DNA-binding response OmpR family regulator